MSFHFHFSPAHSGLFSGRFPGWWTTNSGWVSHTNWSSLMKWCSVTFWGVGPAELLPPCWVLHVLHVHRFNSPGGKILPCVLRNQRDSRTTVNLHQKILPIYLYYDSYGLTSRPSQLHNLYYALSPEWVGPHYPYWYLTTSLVPTCLSWISKRPSAKLWSHVGPTYTL